MTVSIPAQIGPYRIQGVIGRGGMGVVYRAVHEETGAVVALKTVRVTSADLLASIRREVLALRKVAHPDVVRIEEVGVADVGPWYAMELLEGETLRDHLSRLWGLGDDAVLSEADASTMDLSQKVSARTERASSSPMPSAASRPAAARCTLDETLTLFRRLCVPLAFVHGQGIVHRDLKPANVFLRVDGTPVLVDFGVVATAHSPDGREVVDVGAQMVGTTGYMAPEQISGERVDARCDLYALGCMLYEALTGSVPFVGRTAMEVVGMHIMQPPVPPSARVDGVPPALDQLVMRLLAKSPRERIGHADDVASALWQISRARQGSEARLSMPIVKPSAYLYRPGIIGREECVATLRQRVSDLGEGRGGIVLLGGQSGVGKTRIVAEVAQHAGRNNILVVAGKCVSLPRASGAEPGRTATSGSRPGQTIDMGGESRESALHPLRGLFQAIADRCRDEGEATFASWLGTWARVLAHYEPSIAAVPGFEALPELPALPAPAARRRALEAVRDTLEAVSKDEPLMLVIDDLQWADDLTITLLASLSPAFLAKHRVLVLGTFRDDELGDNLPRLLASEAVTRVRVEGLAGRSVSALVSDMLALAEPPPTLVSFLTERSQGNPFYVSEYLRMAIAEGLLSRDLDGRWLLDERGAATLPSPASLLDLVGRRLRGLGPDERAVLESAAVLGREAETSVLIAVSGLGEHAVIDALHELSNRQILEEAEGDRFRLVHDKLREAAWRDLTPKRRRELHHRAAEVLEAELQRDPELEMVHGDLVMHWREAGEPGREAFHAGRAGERSYRDGAFADAVRYLKVAIAWHRGRVRDDAARVAMARWCWQAGDASFVLGDFEQAERWLVAAMEPYEPWAPESGVGRARFLLGHVLEQVRHGMLRARRPSPGDREGLTIAAHAAGKLAHVAIFRGDRAGVLAGSLAAANLAERAGDARRRPRGAGLRRRDARSRRAGAALFRPGASGRGGPPDRGGGDLAGALRGLAARGGVAHGPRREGEGEGARGRGDRAHALHRRPARRGALHLGAGDAALVRRAHRRDAGRRRGGHGRPRRRHVRAAGGAHPHGGLRAPLGRRPARREGRAVDAREAPRPGRRAGALAQPGDAGGRVPRGAPPRGGRGARRRGAAGRRHRAGDSVDGGAPVGGHAGGLPGGASRGDRSGEVRGGGGAHAALGEGAARGAGAGDALGGSARVVERRHGDGGRAVARGAGPGARGRAARRGGARGGAAGGARDARGAGAGRGPGAVEGALGEARGEGEAAVARRVRAEVISPAG